MTMSERTALPRLKRLYVEDRVTLPVFEAALTYYFIECGGTGPTSLGMSIPSSVDPDAPPADPAEDPRVRQYLDD